MAELQLEEGSMLQHLKPVPDISERGDESGLHVAGMRLKYYTEALQQSQLQPNHRITA